MGQDTERPGFTLPANVSNTALLWEVRQLLQMNDVITPGRLPREILAQQHMNDDPIHSKLASGLPTAEYYSAIKRNGLTPTTP